MWRSERGWLEEGEGSIGGGERGQQGEDLWWSIELMVTFPLAVQAERSNCERLRSDLAKINEVKMQPTRGCLDTFTLAPTPSPYCYSHPTLLQLRHEELARIEQNRSALHEEARKQACAEARSCSPSHPLTSSDSPSPSRSSQYLCHASRRNGMQTCSLAPGRRGIR